MREQQRLDGFVDSTQQPLCASKRFLNDTVHAAQTGLVPSEDFATEVIFVKATCRFLQVISKFHCKYIGEDPDEIARSVPAELCIRSGGRSILGAVELKERSLDNILGTLRSEQNRLMNDGAEYESAYSRLMKEKMKQAKASSDRRGSFGKKTR